MRLEKSVPEGKRSLEKGFLTGRGDLRSSLSSDGESAVDTIRSKSFSFYTGLPSIVKLNSVYKSCYIYFICIIVVHQKVSVLLLLKIWFDVSKFGGLIDGLVEFFLRNEPVDIGIVFLKFFNEVLVEGNPFGIIHNVVFIGVHHHE